MTRRKAEVSEPEPNLAVVPEPEVPVEHTYKVVGTQRVLDHDPGETFVATLPLDQEDFLLAGGHLAKEKETA